MKRHFFLLLMVLPNFFFAQSTLINAGFEETPDDATVPVGWFKCQTGTTPDILPGFWGVYTEASEGETFVGLIVRGDGTFESIGQRLSKALKPKECYEFSLDLAQSRTYEGYNKPVRFRVWGGMYKCGKDLLIGETELIDHTDWETYTFSFYPESTINYIVLEAIWEKGKESVKGNVLIDNIQTITKCDRASLR